MPRRARVLPRVLRVRRGGASDVNVKGDVGGKGAGGAAMESVVHAGEI